jgi:hypothetical protein
MFLSKLGYSELVQRLFEKMTFSLVDPLQTAASGVGDEMMPLCLHLE